MFLLSSCVSVLIIYLGIYFLFTRKKQDGRNNTTAFLSLSDITIVIPFRNEEKNLRNLVADLKKQNGTVKNIVFIDDYSTDQSNSILRKELENSSINFSMVQLHDGLGKKTAIAAGVRSAKSEFILQLDADVRLTKNYFNALQKLQQKDLIVLPVVLKNANYGLKMFELDFLFFQALNFKLRKRKVLTASGANLLYKKKSYLEAIEKTKGQEYLSGDDYFLLEQMNQLNLNVGVEANLSLCVESALPTTLIGCLQQRLRWLSKSSFQDVIAMFLLFVYQVFSLFVLFKLQVNYLGLYFFLIKSLIDIAFVYEYLKSLKRSNYLFYVPFFFGLLPLYFLLLFFAYFTIPKSWKGRPLKQKQS